MKYLKLMLESAENKDKLEFERLNSLFDIIFTPLKPSSRPYDLFRQSCLCCFVFPELYQTCLDDARTRLKELEEVYLR